MKGHLLPVAVDTINTSTLKTRLRNGGVPNYLIDIIGDNLDNYKFIPVCDQDCEGKIKYTNHKFISPFFFVQLISLRH